MALISRRLLFSVLGLSLFGWAHGPAATHKPAPRDPNLPAYHAHPPRGPLPATLPPEQFSDPRVQNAYAMAAKIRKVLYQLPCYCRCDLELGHRSLLDCYAGTHASVCSTCMKEGIFAYQETMKGKSPAQIRAEIEKGLWGAINLNDYLRPQTY